MSRLYGVVSHAAMCKILKKYKNTSFCECCNCDLNNSIQFDKLTEMKKDFHIEMVQFLQNNHLSVFVMEKKIYIPGLNGRIDCVFIENVHRKKLYIIDWKFTKNIPNELTVQHRIQLSLYAYIMKRMESFCMYEYETYCFFFSPDNQIKILNCKILEDDFVESLITRMCF